MKQNDTRKQTINSIMAILLLVSVLIAVLLGLVMSDMNKTIKDQKAEIELRDKTIGLMVKTIDRYQIRENCLSKGGNLQDCREIVPD